MHRSYNNFCLSVLFKISSFCTTKKQETGLEHHDGEQIFIFHFYVNGPLN